MDITLWIIISLVTNLSGDYSKDFTLTVETESKEIQFDIFKMYGNSWTVIFPKKDEKDRDIPINYKIEDETIFNFFLLEEKIDLNKFIDAENIDWKKVEKIKLLKELTDKGENTIIIERNDKGFSMSQKEGFLKKYDKITVQW